MAKQRFFAIAIKKFFFLVAWSFYHTIQLNKKDNISSLQEGDEKNQVGLRTVETVFSPFYFTEKQNGKFSNSWYSCAGSAGGLEQ